MTRQAEGRVGGEPAGPGVAGGAMQRLATELAVVADDVDAELAVAARAVAERLRLGRFEVAVAGAFNRGKSTLCNALVGAEVLPSGVVPLTAVGTELCGGQGPIQVVGTDGRRRSLADDETLADLVTEAGNPGNWRGVARVVVPVVAPLLEGGLVLVDTPGTGSVHRHNDDEAARQLLQADGVVVVLSADSPLADDERELLALLRDRHARTFYVCNRADHLTDGELAEVRRFVSEQVTAALGRAEPLWCVSARAGLQAAMAGDPPGAVGYDWPAFVDAFTTFARRGLVGARHEAARHRLVELCDRLDDRLTLADAAARLDAEALASATAAFRSAASTELQGWADDVAPLRRDVANLVDRLGRDLAAASSVPAAWAGRLASAAAGVGKAQLAGVLDTEVERIVRDGFDDIRRAQARSVDDAWVVLAERARSRAEARVNSLRRHAADVFDAELAAVTLPAPSEEPGDFSYHFLTVETPADQVAALLRLLLPASVLRRRLLAGARRRLARELDKHVGRARADLAARIADAGRRLEAALGQQVAAAAATVLDVAERAEHLGHEQAEGRAAARRDRAAARATVGRVRTALLAQEHGWRRGNLSRPFHVD